MATTLTVVGAGVAGLTLGAAGALLLVAVVAGLVTLGCWQLRPGPERPHPSGPDVLCGLLCGITALAVTGLVAVFGPSGCGLTVLVAAVGWWVLRGPGRTPTPRRQPPDSGHLIAPQGPAIEELPAAPQPTMAMLPTLSTPQLCWTWRVSYVRMQRSSYPSELDELAQLRGGCLEELQRRDPAAFARWFPTARAASDPARFFFPGVPDVARPPHTPPSVRPPAGSPAGKRSDGAARAHGTPMGPATAGEPRRAGTASDAQPASSPVRARPGHPATAAHTPTEPAQNPKSLPAPKPASDARRPRRNEP